MLKSGKLLLLLILGTGKIFACPRIPSKPPAVLAVRLDLNLKQIYQIGKEDIFFASIQSVCEDDSGNTYVIDRKEYKILILSPEGKLIKSFGKRGQGPGDLSYPNDINYWRNDTLIVTEDMNRITYFSTGGKFVRDIRITGRFDLKAAGDQLFYAWIWVKEGRQQVLVDARNAVKHRLNTMPRSKFSVSAPDQSGRQVMFGYSNDTYVPAFLFSYYKGFCAIGVNEQYEIAIFDKTGRGLRKISHPQKPLLLTEKERSYLEEDIDNHVQKRRWPGSIGQKLKAKIPTHKVLINRIFLTSKFLIVFKSENDISQPKKEIPVDIFGLDGEFVGSGLVTQYPFYVSDRHFYFRRTDSEDDLLLVKKSYKVNF